MRLSTLIPLPEPHCKAIIDGFRDYVKANCIKEGGVAYVKAHRCYFIASITSMRTMGYSCPPIWNICIFSGRDISNENKPI